MRTLSGKLSISVLFMMLGAHHAAAGEYEIGQSNMRFTANGKKIDVLRINVGDTVRFKNEDSFYHGIYSLSDINTFELEAFRKGQTRSVTFNKAGRAEIECAVHADMYLVIDVNDINETNETNEAKAGEKNIRAAQ